MIGSARLYTPHRWFWVVGDDDGQVFSSEIGAYIARDNPAFLAFEAAGCSPTRIASEADLRETLIAQGLRSVAPCVSLKDYAAHKRWQVEVGGIEVHGVLIPTHDRAKFLLLAATLHMADAASAPFVTNGVNHGIFSKAQFVEINAAVTAHVQGTFCFLADLIERISDGSIKSSEEIDVAFAVVYPSLQ
jgi:hypothetical protein